MSAASIERLHAPSAEALQHLFGHPSGPTVITGVVEQWPAHARWTDAYLERAAAGNRVDVTVTDSGRGVSARTQKESVELGDCLRRLVTADASVRHYVSALPLSRVPALLEDVDVGRLVVGHRYQGPNLWAGADGARSRLHFDATHGCMAMLRGKKRFVFFAPETPVSQIYPYPLFTRSPNWSRVEDVDDPDLERFPGFAKAERVEVILEAGQVLFIPAHWWHFVVGVGINIGVNVWFPAPMRRFLASYCGLRSLVHEAMKRQPYLNRFRTQLSDEAV